MIAVVVSFFLHAMFALSANITNTGVDRGRSAHEGKLILRIQATV